MRWTRRDGPPRREAERVRDEWEQRALRAEGGEERAGEEREALLCRAADLQDAAEGEAQERLFQASPRIHPSPLAPHPATRTPKPHP